MSRADMRAGDGDREAVAGRLREALNEGRLDLHEYDERLQSAYAAKTFGELDGLLTDLPPASAQQLQPAGATAPAVTADGRYPDATRRWLAENWQPYLGVVAITTAIWAVLSIFDGDLLYFWPGWVAGPWGAVLLVTTFVGLSSGEPQRWAAKQARKAAKEATRSDTTSDDDD